MPSWSNATPIIVGQRIFANSEPFNLVCVDKATGKILWQRSNAFEDTVDPKAIEQAKAEEERVRPILEERRQFVLMRMIAKRKLERDPGNTDAKKQLEQAEAKLAETDPALADYEKRIRIPTLPSTQRTNGYSSSTPVSDGKSVFVVYGNGYAGAYGLDGERKWLRFVERPLSPRGWGHSASPVLTDGKAIVHLNHLTALDADTGGTLWQTKDMPPRWGTPIVSSIGEVAVLITPGGEIVRAHDGRLLAKQVSDLTYGTPVQTDDTVYFMQGRGAAVRLPGQAGESVAVEKLWEPDLGNDRYYASPVIYDGLVYTINQARLFSVLDAHTGEEVYSKRLELGRGTAYPSVSLAGGRLYVSSDNGTTIVMKPGREYQEIARNTLEAFRSTPVFEGKRMYVRTLATLYCVAAEQ